MSAASDFPDNQAPRAGSTRIFLRLLWMLRPEWRMIALGVVLLVLAMPCELFPGLVWKYVTDDVILTGQSPPTPVLSSLISLGGRLSGWRALVPAALTWLLVVYLVGEALGTLSTWLMSRVAQRFILMFRNRVYRKLQSQSLAYLQRQRTGDLMSRAMGDVDELQSFIVNGIDVILGEGMLWFATVALVMAINWRVASAALAPLLLVYLLLRIFNQRIAPIYKAARDRAGDVSTRLQENLSGVVVIKIFGREKQEGQRFEAAANDYYDQQIRAVNARSLYFPFSRAVGFFSNINMLGVGAYLILTRQGFTVGDLLLFRAYWWRLFGPIQTLARVNDMVQRAVAAARRVFEVLDAPDELPDAPDATPIEKVVGALELKNVTFRYATQPDPITGFQQVPESDGHGLETRDTKSPVVLHQVSMRIDPGQTVALCGPSGGGKSTILNLLLRFYDPTSGVVLLDGRDLRSIARGSLRRHFALVQQETFLFNDTILDNIRYGHPEATMDRIVSASQAANAHEFITRLAKGYDTKVGERGVRLSGGQKQRISIARAFLANPQVLLLDEPTSSVEPESETAIINALERLMMGRTTVLTSHRPSLIRQADTVYVIEEGTVTDFGAPEDVRARNAWLSRFLSSADLP